MTTATTQNVLELARQHHDWFNRRNVEEASKHVADTAEFVNVAFDEKLRGQSGYRDFTGRWTTAFPDARTEIVHAFACGDTAVVEFRGRGTHTGPLESPTGRIQPTQRRLDMQFCEIYEFNKGNLAKVRLYFDSATMMRQLGITPTAPK